MNALMYYPVILCDLNQSKLVFKFSFLKCLFSVFALN